MFEGSLQPVIVNSAKGGPVLKVYFTATNTFTETLQSHGALTGTISIVLASDTSYHRTIQLDSSYLVTAQNLDPRTGLVTLDPGASLLFLAIWDFTDDYGHLIPGNGFLVAPDPACPTLVVADPQLLILTCTFQVFDRVGQVVVQPVRYELAYRAGQPC
ncbi:MAG TPA: hypothetical protein VMM37_02930 [Bacteroidota bacterium]|nr:hypothetical protein [Bacteroidota bacterium]